MEVSSLPEFAASVHASAHKAMVLHVTRGMDECFVLRLIPQPWAGQGTLGMRVVLLKSGHELPAGHNLPAQ
jgi:hypothetical protein